MKGDSTNIGGVEYCVGSAGSLILGCPKCGEEHFRCKLTYHNRVISNNINENCFSCGEPMEAIRADELETKWKPLWKSLGWKVWSDEKGDYV